MLIPFKTNANAQAPLQETKLGLFLVKCGGDTRVSGIYMHKAT